MSRRNPIEAMFSLRQVSLDSVHGRNVRHGHASAPEIWLAQRPLAATRALLVMLLPDLGGQVGRWRWMARHVAGAPTTSGELAKFRAETRETFEGRAPRVPDPFAGDGAIPLEATGLGCEAVAADVNPVVWFISRSTGRDAPQAIESNEKGGEDPCLSCAG